MTASLGGLACALLSVLALLASDVARAEVVRVNVRVNQSACLPL